MELHSLKSSDMSPESGFDFVVKMFYAEVRTNMSSIG